MTFEYYNPNPDASTFKSGKPKSWNRKDSAIRSICKALNQTWDITFAHLSEIAKTQHNMPDSKDVVDTYLISNGYRYVTYGKPAIGQKRPTVTEFADTNNKGIFLVYLRDYYITIIDGVIYNTSEEMKDASVYSYWTK